MPMYTLTVLDTPGIQPYIFGSNRLQENIGASELVRLATGTWPLEILKNQFRSNVAIPDAVEPDRWLNPDLRIEEEEIEAEVVVIAGGKVTVLFADGDRARQFVTALHRVILQEAPGLDLVAVHVMVDWDRDTLSTKMEEAYLRLDQEKAARPASQPLLGLGVTAACQSTGLVATSETSKQGPISDAIAAKLAKANSAHQRLLRLFTGDIERAGYDFPRDFDEFGRSKDQMSYLAIVHADGNGMGRFFRRVGEAARGSRDYIERMRTASIEVEQVGRAALYQTVSALLGAIRLDAQGRYYIGDDSRQLPVRMLGSNLPFRPLVFGGDDVTFICDGRLGLALAVEYLEAFEQESQRRHLDLHACAGAAIVKTHYPFARAYELSGALTRSAKTFVHKQGHDGSAIDWHIAASGLSGDLDDIRNREYQVPGYGSLVQRPVLFSGSRRYTWSGFVSAVEGFNKGWADRRNKAMQLREALRHGPDTTRAFLQAYNEELPMLDQEIAELHETGWFHAQCGYFDALEALDFYVPLKGEQDGKL